MINETALRGALLFLAEIAKGQFETIAALTDELSAVKETVRGLDPAFDDILAAKRQQALQNDIPLMSDIVVRLDEIIRRLTDGEVC